MAQRPGLWVHQTRDASVINATAAWLINGKSVAQESLSERELLARDLTNPKLAPLVHELQALRERLGSLSLSASKPEGAAVQQAKLLQLSSEEYRLTQALTQAAGTTLPARDWIEVEHVRRKLPAASLYVDLLRVEPLDFSVTTAKKRERRPHYAAWLVPAHGRGEVRFVDLGPAAPIDAAVEQARHALAQTASSQAS